MHLSSVRTSLKSSVALIAACAILSAATLGCTPAQQKSAKYVAGEIAAELPRAQPYLETVEGLAALALPTDAPLVVAFSSTVNASLVELGALCQAYAAAPTDEVWASIVAAVDKVVNTGSAALLDAAHITNPASRAVALASLGALQSVLLVIDGFVQTSRTAQQNAAVAQTRAIKVSQLKPYLDRKVIEQASGGYSFDQVYGYETSLGF